MKISQKIIIFILLQLLIFVGLMPAHATPPGPQPQINPGLATVQTPDGFTIFAEIANTPNQRSTGLMYRTRIAPDRGMIFTFPEPGSWTFWMKNTKMALDILWIDEKGKIVHIQHAAPICEREDNLCPRYRTNIPAILVLELGAGRAEKLNLTPGKKLEISWP